MNEAAPPTVRVSFLAAAAALETIDQTVREAQQQPAGAAALTVRPAPDSGPHPALAALLTLREVREQLAGWESGLIETARGQGRAGPTSPARSESPAVKRPNAGTCACAPAPPEAPANSVSRPPATRAPPTAA